jgi:hypothetical protein
VALAWAILRGKGNAWGSSRKMMTAVYGYNADMVAFVWKELPNDGRPPRPNRRND